MGNSFAGQAAADAAGLISHYRIVLLDLFRGQCRASM
jgi:hypothetical protein